MVQRDLVKGHGFNKKATFSPFLSTIPRVVDGERRGLPLFGSSVTQTEWFQPGVSQVGLSGVRAGPNSGGGGMHTLHVPSPKPLATRPKGWSSPAGDGVSAMPSPGQQHQSPEVGEGREEAARRPGQTCSGLGEAAGREPCAKEGSRQEEPGWGGASVGLADLEWSQISAAGRLLRTAYKLGEMYLWGGERDGRGSMSGCSGMTCENRPSVGSLK